MCWFYLCKYNTILHKGLEHVWIFFLFLFLLGLLLFFETRPHCISQAGVKLKILQYQPPKYWYYTHVPPCLAIHVDLDGVGS